MGGDRSLVENSSIFFFGTLPLAVNPIHNLVYAIGLQSLGPVSSSDTHIAIFSHDMARFYKSI